MHSFNHNNLQRRGKSTSNKAQKNQILEAEANQAKTRSEWGNDVCDEASGNCR